MSPARTRRGRCEARSACFLTPSVESAYTYPPGLKDEVSDVVGEYLFDVKDFRTENKAWLLEQLYEMTDRRFRLAEHLLATRPWQLFAMVEMGHDRIHHGFWKFMDAEHRKHEPGSAFESAILDYYRHVDGLIAGLLEYADEETLVLVVSDHGAKRLDGGIRVNEWLRREGLLALQAEPNGVCLPHEVGIDWPRTTAWGDGGYYARLFLNVRDREPEGVVAPRTTKRCGTTLRGGSRRSRTMRETDRDACLQAGRAVRRGERRRAGHHRRLRRSLWRSVATIGGDEGVHTLENDTGPDDANHAQDGMIVAAGAGVTARGRLDAHLLDIAPTVLELLGMDVPADMRGTTSSSLSSPHEPRRLGGGRAARRPRRYYGAQHVATPTIDELAAGGVRSTRQSAPRRGRLRRRRR